MDAKDRIIQELRELIEELRREIEELKLALAKATKDSSNSSKSPSSDIVKPPKRDAQGKSARKKRKRGGQRGHKRTLRQPLPPDRIDEAFVYKIPDDEVRNRKLTPTDDFEIVQHVELLDMPIYVTEHRRDEMSDAGRHRSFVMHRDKFLDIAAHPPDVPEARTLADRFAAVECEDGSRYDMSRDYFRFLFEPGVEPTNNHTEQQIRHCVIDRRITQGTRSERGQRYHARMWTAIATCTKQGRSFFDFLHGSILAHLTDEPAPSLLPIAAASEAAAISGKAA